MNISHSYDSVYPRRIAPATERPVVQDVGTPPVAAPSEPVARPVNEVNASRVVREPGENGTVYHHQQDPRIQTFLDVANSSHSFHLIDHYI